MNNAHDANPNSEKQKDSLTLKFAPGPNRKVYAGGKVIPTEQTESFEAELDELLDRATLRETPSISAVGREWIVYQYTNREQSLKRAITQLADQQTRAALERVKGGVSIGTELEELS